MRECGAGLAICLKYIPGQTLQAWADEVRPNTQDLAEKLARVLHKIQTEPLVFPAKVNEDFQAICAKAMAKRPGDRYATLNSIVSNNLGNTPFGRYASQFLTQVSSEASFGQAGLKTLNSIVSNNLGNTPFGQYAAQFLTQISSGTSFGQAGLALFDKLIAVALATNPFGAEVALLLQQAGSGATVNRIQLRFTDDTLGQSPVLLISNFDTSLSLTAAAVQYDARRG